MVFVRDVSEDMAQEAGHSESAVVVGEVVGVTAGWRKNTNAEPGD